MLQMISYPCLHVSTNTEIMRTLLISLLPKEKLASGALFSSTLGRCCRLVNRMTSKMV